MLPVFKHNGNLWFIKFIHGGKILQVGYFYKLKSLGRALENLWRQNKESCLAKSPKKISGHTVCSDSMAPRIIFMWTYYGGAPDEDMSEILSERQKY